MYIYIYADTYINQKPYHSYRSYVCQLSDSELGHHLLGRIPNDRSTTSPPWQLLAPEASAQAELVGAMMRGLSGAGGPGAEVTKNFGTIMGKRKEHIHTW